MNCEKLPKTISAEELLSTPLPPVKWIIPDLLPAGLALFAGPSKAGKSWLTLWLCLQVAQGKPMWGREIEPHTVLYLSLEDTFNRLQKRLLQLVGSEEAPERLVMQTECGSIGQGLEEQLVSFIYRNPDAGLVQPHGDGIQASALGSPTKHPLHHDGGNRVDDKLVAIVLGFQIAVGSTRTDELAVLHGLPLLRPDLAPDVQSVGFVYHVPQRNDDTGMGILWGGGVEVFIDRNKADITDAEILFDVVAGVDGVPPQTGEVFHNDAVDVTSLNI